MDQHTAAKAVEQAMSALMDALRASKDVDCAEVAAVADQMRKSREVTVSALDIYYARHGQRWTTKQ